MDKWKDEHMVSLAVDGNAEEVRFTIEDNGIGMNQEVRDKAFTLFFSSKGSGGTGLGLFIAHKIIQAHGGRIDLDSEEGRGTRFGITIPRIHVDQVPAAEPDATVEPPPDQAAAWGEALEESCNRGFDDWTWTGHTGYNLVNYKVLLAAAGVWMT